MQSAQSENPDLRVRFTVLTTITAFAATFLLTANGVAGGLVRVNDGRDDYEGKVIALSGTTCSLIDRQGKLVQLNVRALKSFKKVSSRFTPLATSELRDSLRQEFNGSYDVAGTTHYLVCAQGDKASQYANLFESIYRDVEHFYRVRGFDVQQPDVPLIAVVFGSQKEFAQYCRKDRVPVSSGLMGYYSLTSNRVALFDDSNLLSMYSQESTNDAENRIEGDSHTRTFAALAGISGGTAGTIIHETTHQVGYNIGIHSRLGGTPVWVVEGLATVLEPDGMRNSAGRRRIEDRLNSERINWFQQKHRPDRQMGNLGKLVASDDHFHRSTLDSYSESWAFSFFLLENASRRQDFVRYLQKVSERDPTKPYTAKKRLSDFQTSFGDIGRLELEFIRFMDRM